MGSEAPLQTGKIPNELLTELLAGLPSPPPEVLLGPSLGEDACAIEVAGGVVRTAIVAPRRTTLDRSLFQANSARQGGAVFV